MKHQIDLFEHVAGAYGQPHSGQLSNTELYRMTTGRAGIDPQQLETKTKIGKAGHARNTLKRSIRWHQHNRELMCIDTQPINIILWTFVLFMKRLHLKIHTPWRDWKCTYSICI